MLCLLGIMNRGMTEPIVQKEISLLLSQQKAKRQKSWSNPFTSCSTLTLSLSLSLSLYLSLPHSWSEDWRMCLTRPSWPPWSHQRPSPRSAACCSRRAATHWGWRENPGEYEKREIRINGLWGGRGERDRTREQGWPKLRSMYTDCAFILCIERGRAGGSLCCPHTVTAEGSPRSNPPLVFLLLVIAVLLLSIPGWGWPPRLTPLPLFFRKYLYTVAASLLPAVCVLFSLCFSAYY